jgi:hypothetical protein
MELIELNCEINASIISILNEYGDRVYQLKFDKPVKKTACVHLSLAGHEDQKDYYLRVTNSSVDVIVHKCFDLAGEPDTFYAWQPRIPGMPHACPRCKTRIDIVRG